MGTYGNIRITVSDGATSAVLGPFSIAVISGNRAPTISGSPATSVNANTPYSFIPNTTDPDGDNLTFSISGKPVWAQFSASNGALSGTPGDGDVGVYSGIGITVSDGQASATLGPFSIAVISGNRAPTISGTPATSVNANSPYSFIPNTSDPDGDNLTFSISGKPVWAVFDASTGRLSGTPGAGHVGTYGNIRITVSDGATSAVLGPFSIAVISGNRAPTIGGSPATSVNANSAYSFIPNSTDLDGDNLTFSISGRPGWAQFSASNGALSGTPGDGDVGVYSGIGITVSDGQASATLGPFSIAVISGNRAPTISGTPATSVNANSPYSFIPNSSDPDGDNLTFSISGRPGWAQFSASNGALSGTPGDGDVGVYSGIGITVSDGQASATLGPFAISVNALSNGTVTLSGMRPRRTRMERH